MFVQSAGIDFFLLEPRWLAIALFIALPGLYGAATSVLAERLLNREASAVRWWHSKPVTVAGGAVLLVGFGVACYFLVGESIAIL